MAEKFLKAIYENLRDKFNGISKKSWIWADFFDNEKTGFDYFKEQIENDADFSYLKEDCDFDDELAYDVASEIASKLRANDFFNMRVQSYYKKVKCGKI